MILFRQCAVGLPFFWETSEQPAARWHAAGDGPVHYLADSADAAWAEYLRHEEISDPEQVREVRRSLWGIEVPDVYSSALPLTTLGNRLAAEDVPYEECQQESLRLRSLGFEGFRSPSSAINADCCYKYAVNGGEQVAGRDSGTVYVLFGPRPDLQGSLLVFSGHPRPDLASRVRPLPPEIGPKLLPVGTTQTPGTAVALRSDAAPDIGTALQSLWKSFFASLILKDDQGRLEACNGSFLRFTGRDEKELVGKLPSQYWAPEKGLVFERYDAIVRSEQRAVISREIFTRRRRFTARWPTSAKGWYGSLSVYLSSAQQLINRLHPQALEPLPIATPPEPSVCRAFFDSCPWAISVRDMNTELVVYVNRAFARVFTPIRSKFYEPDDFIGTHPRDYSPEPYWRDNESRVVRRTSTLETGLESETRVEHPHLRNAPRKVAKFNFGDPPHRFRGTIGIDEGYLERLDKALPYDAEFIEPLRIPEDDRR